MKISGDKLIEVYHTWLKDYFSNVRLTSSKVNRLKLPLAKNAPVSPTFQGSKNTANKKTRQNILSKKAAKLKKNPYRIGYNPFKPGNLLKFLFPVFSLKSVQI